MPKTTAPGGRPPLAGGADLLRLDKQLCFALYASSLAMTKVYKPLLDDLGLTYPQFLVMMALWEHDHRSVGELGDQLFLDSGTLTPLLKRMESSGLVVRARAKDDERRVVVTLTPAGAALREKAERVPVEIARAVQASADEVIDLRERLHGLRERLAGAQHRSPR
ncbi:MarR family winged helix-turn-helix transcriptional regulator [Piscinibacter gummiphilus]|uniref:MarR family transcriptional regulator n=1 Tax=Piscinibacter gummiphilus TaxID=946333 RepID=A0A1W6LF86_9BURK|nr:MarR family transcriptional regulator [Piscinibacter gummiphilus]ARN22886.1 MarR family transcriptional regulator [Piscinibacter gummiphilus]ATU67585.1 MarR family transcriptional regulator [Piscinibacter gummiphilus]